MDLEIVGIGNKDMCWECWYTSDRFACKYCKIIYLLMMAGF